MQSESPCNIKSESVGHNTEVMIGFAIPSSSHPQKSKSKSKSIHSLYKTATPLPSVTFLFSLHNMH